MNVKKADRKPKRRNMKIDPSKNTIVCGDNLEWLNWIPDESVDLCYIDPPFFSNRNYEVVWGNGAELRSFGDRYSGGISHYIEWMRERVSLIHRKLKPTGSIFLHCDWHASHRLRVLLDDIFGESNFRNEIIWKRSSNTSSINGIYKRAHDSIFFYSKSDSYSFHIQRRDLSETSKKLYSKKDARGTYQLVPLLVSGRRNGETGKIWRGIDPNARGAGGMHWVTTPDKLNAYDRKGLVVFSKNGLPRLKYYLEDNEGVPCSDVWDDVNLISSNGKESLGYPTQKPEELVARVIQSGSNPGDMILDCFAGGGTTAKVAAELNRRFIVGDVSPVAVRVIAERIGTNCQSTPFVIKNLPTTEVEFRSIDGNEFANLFCDIVGWKVNEKKTNDGGIDGYDGNGVPVQIKNHKNATGRPDIQRFLGALMAVKSKTGKFVAWEFAKGAMEYIADIKREHGIVIEPVKCADRLGSLIITPEKQLELAVLYEQKRKDHPGKPGEVFELPIQKKKEKKKAA